MTQDIASAASATLAVPAASAGWTLSPAASSVPFRKDAGDSFPLGGALMLIVLMAAAVWAWWYGRVKGLRPGRTPFLPALLARATGSGGELRVVEVTQAAGGVRLMIVEWAGGRRVLVGASGTGAPVALDVVAAPASSGEEAA